MLWQPGKILPRYHILGPECLDEIIPAHPGGLRIYLQHHILIVTPFAFIVTYKGDAGKRSNLSR